jgi:hypothetical protein
MVLCECFSSLRLFALRSAEICTVLWCGCGFRKAMVSMIYSDHKEAEQGEKLRHSQKHRRVEKLARESVTQSTNPSRPLAHPSELPIVRPKSSHRSGSQERITDFDGLGTSSNPIDPPTSGVAQGRTEELFDADVFHNMESALAIDEIATHPPDVSGQLHHGSSNATYEPSNLSEMDTLLTSSIQRKQTEGFPPVETQQLATIRQPTGMGQIPQPHEFFLWRYFDNVRWWLIYPGRLEFLFWLIGIFVLVCITSLFLFVITVSLGWFGSGTGTP